MSAAEQKGLAAWEAKRQNRAPREVLENRSGHFSGGVRVTHQEQAIDYATGRACFRSGEIRILDSSGDVERTIPFNEAERKM